jgi:hypothetical protein
LKVIILVSVQPDYRMVVISTECQPEHRASDSDLLYGILRSRLPQFTALDEMIKKMALETELFPGLAECIRWVAFRSAPPNERRKMPDLISK